MSCHLNLLVCLIMWLDIVKNNKGLYSKTAAYFFVGIVLVSAVETFFQSWFATTAGLWLMFMLPNKCFRRPNAVDPSHFYVLKRKGDWHVRMYQEEAISLGMVEAVKDVWQATYDHFYDRCGERLPDPTGALRISPSGTVVCLAWSDSSGKWASVVVKEGFFSTPFFFREGLEDGLTAESIDRVSREEFLERICCMNFYSPSEFTETDE